MPAAGRPRADPDLAGDFIMTSIALTLLTFAVFAVLTIVAVTAALKSARVENVIDDVFTPWPESETRQPDGRPG